MERDQNNELENKATAPITSLAIIEWANAVSEEEEEVVVVVYNMRDMLGLHHEKQPGAII